MTANDARMSEPLPHPPPAPATLAGALVPAFLLLIGARTVLRLVAAALRGRAAARRVLLVGTGPGADELLGNVDSWPGLGIDVVGVCADTAERTVGGRP